MKCHEMITHHRFAWVNLVPFIKFSRDTKYRPDFLFWFWKIDAAVAESVPLVAHMSKNWLSTLPVFTWNIFTVKGFIFSKPVSFEPSVNKENRLHFMIFTVSLKKCGAFAPLMIHVVFEAAAEYFCAIFVSGNSFGSIRLWWLENAREILFSAISTAIFTSALVTWNNNRILA